MDDLSSNKMDPNDKDWAKDKSRCGSCDAESSDARSVTQNIKDDGEEVDNKSTHNLDGSGNESQRYQEAVLPDMSYAQGLRQRIGGPLHRFLCYTIYMSLVYYIVVTAFIVLVCLPYFHWYGDDMSYAENKMFARRRWIVQRSRNPGAYGRKAHRR